MTDETLAATGSVIVASPYFSSDTTLVWHAGEPCVLPPDWYAQAIETLESTGGQSIARQAFQTNGTLVSDPWLDYWAKPGVSVGVSLDGPREIHDRWRRTRTGGGTFDRTMQGIARIRDRGLPFHIIAVISAASLDHPEAIADALADTGAGSIGLNVEEEDGVFSGSSLFQSIDMDRYAQFLNRFAERLERRDNPPRFREFDRLSALFKQSGGAGIRSQEAAAGAIISVSAGGDISTFSPELLGLTSPDYGNFAFGNVHRLHDLGQIFLNRAFLKSLGEISRGIAQCKASCEYFDLCGGGSPSNKMGEAGRFDVARTRHCSLSVQATASALLKHLEKEVV